MKKYRIILIACVLLGCTSPQIKEETALAKPINDQEFIDRCVEIFYENNPDIERPEGWGTYPPPSVMCPELNKVYYGDSVDYYP
ncbi:MAG: hypothetical protein AAFX87_28430 [Bacteroidota bacterium]